jgi:hypothetical protein
MEVAIVRTMNRNTAIGILLLAACSLVVWALRTGTLRAPGSGCDVTIAAVVAAIPQEITAAPQDDPGANGYGSISGRIIFEGDVPALPVLVRAGDRNLKPEDRQICASDEIPDESLVIDEKTRGIANVFVYLPKATRGIHPKLRKSEKQQVLSNIKGCRVFPHALFARTDQKIVVRMEDDIVHNVQALTRRNDSFGKAITARELHRELKFQYARAEPRPFPVVCDLHSWMSAYWLVLDHPYAAISDSQGRFAIADLPAGEYSLHVWHERAGDMQRELAVTIKAGETNDLAMLRVPAEKFADPPRLKR